MSLDQDSRGPSVLVPAVLCIAVWLWAGPLASYVSLSTDSELQSPAPHRDWWQGMCYWLPFIKHLIIFHLLIYKYLLSIYFMDQGYSSVKAKTAFSREWKTDIKYKTMAIISLNYVCVKCYKGEIPGALRSLIRHIHIECFTSEMVMCQDSQL